MREILYHPFERNLVLLLLAVVAFFVVWAIRYWRLGRDDPDD